MLLGIDVGGTHTDAALLDAGKVVASAKVATDHDNLLHSIRTALQEVLEGVDASKVRRLNLSTTLSTNAIIEGKTEDVGVLVSAGPGIDVENHRIGGHFHVLNGSIDHRGTERQPLDGTALTEAVSGMREAGVRAFAAVSKFSTRNPEHEEAMAASLTDEGGADYVTRGHTLSGVLNFPRRIATAYFNSAVWRVYNDFAWAVAESVEDFGLSAEIGVLKADGGTMPLSVSQDYPVESILSGPAASVMGMIALCDIRDDCVILDVGGTTTDIAVFADGSPLIEEQGMTVGSYPTLVKALKVRSIGIGGDSTIHVSQSGVTVGPDRKGPSLANCNADNGRKRKCVPALTDALNYLGLSEFGDVEASRHGIEKLAGLWDMKPKLLAQSAVDYAVDRIISASRDLVDEINSKPVYTIFELLKGKQLKPSQYYLMGGPAQALTEPLAEAAGLRVRLPDHFSVANAIGAALTRPTLEIELFADTQKKRMYIPSLDVKRDIESSYSVERAEADALDALAEYMREMDTDDDVEQAVPEITESGSFNMVEHDRTMGRNIRVQAQVRPGIVRQAR